MTASLIDKRITKSKIKVAYPTAHARDKDEILNSKSVFFKRTTEQEHVRLEWK